MDETFAVLGSGRLVAVGTLAGDGRREARPRPARRAAEDGSAFTRTRTTPPTLISRSGASTPSSATTPAMPAVPAGTAPRGGVRIFDIANPASPYAGARTSRATPTRTIRSSGTATGTAIADLLLVAVDRTMASPNVRGPTRRARRPDRLGGRAGLHAERQPGEPVRNMTQVGCGTTRTAAPTRSRSGPERPRGRTASSSSTSPRIRSGPGPTCGPAINDVTSPTTRTRPSTTRCTEDPVRRGAAEQSGGLLRDRRAADQLPRRSRQPDRLVRASVTGPGPCPIPGAIEQAARACHDIVVHIEENMAGAACAEQGQVWEIDPTPGSRTRPTRSRSSTTRFSSGGTGNIPGAVDFFHSVMFNNDGTVLNTVDESFGTGCPPMTTYQPRPWNPAGGTHKTGKMFFSDMETGKFFSEFQVGDVRPDPTRGRVLLGAHGHGRHGHREGPARQRLVHGRGRRDQLHRTPRS